MPFASIHNRFERIVIDEVHTASVRFPDLVGDNEVLADVACIALNSVPAHYIRHDVDASFHISTADHERDRKAIAAAVHSALALVQSRRGRRT